MRSLYSIYELRRGQAHCYPVYSPGGLSTAGRGTLSPHQHIHVATGRPPAGQPAIVGGRKWSLLESLVLYTCLFFPGSFKSQEVDIPNAVLFSPLFLD